MHLSVTQRLSLIGDIKSVCGADGLATQDVEALSLKYNVSCQTVRNHHKSMQQMEPLLCERIPASKRIRETLQHPVLQRLVDVLRTHTAAGNPLTTRALWVTANAMACNLGADRLSYSQIQSWCKRNDVRVVRCHGEAASADKEAAALFVRAFPDIISGYTPDLIFNADETAVFYRQFSKMVRSINGEPVQGHKQMKDRFTLLVCANMTGTVRIPLCVVSSAKELDDPSDIATRVLKTASGWMTAESFSQWLQVIFIPMVKAYMHGNDFRDKRVLLLVDNCRAHSPPTKNKPSCLPAIRGLRVVFLPPRTSAVLQPMDQGIISSLKRHYRSSLEEEYARHITSHHPISFDEFASHIDIRYAARLLDFCWRSKMSFETLRNGWRKVSAQHSISDVDAVDNEDAELPEDEEEEGQSEQE